MTRRKLLGVSLAVLATLGLPVAAAVAADKPGPLEVTYYYLPG